MKTVHIIKSLTLLMFVLILGGFVLITLKISEKSTDSKPKMKLAPAGIVLSDEENIASVTPCGNFACVLVTGQARTSTLIIINPTTGSIEHRLSFDKNEK